MKNKILNLGLLLSQDLESGCPILATVKYLGILFFFLDRPQYTQISTKNKANKA